MRDYRRNEKAPLLPTAHAANERDRAQDAEGLSETRHKQRKRCAGSPSRRGRCESDRGAPKRLLHRIEVSHSETNTRVQSHNYITTTGVLTFPLRTRSRSLSMVF